MEHLRLLNIFNVLFYIANGLWLLEFFIFRNRKRTGKFQEKKSFWFLSISILVVIVSTIYFSSNDLGKLTETSLYPALQIIALILQSMGLWLRYQGSFVLGQNFTRHVAVSSSLTLVSNGPYRYFRHPLYLGLFLITIAFPIFVGNLVAILIALPLLWIGFSWRMTVEEKALSLIHPKYQAWLKSRYRFIPGIY